MKCLLLRLSINKDRWEDMWNTRPFTGGTVQMWMAASVHVFRLEEASRHGKGWKYWHWSLPACGRVRLPANVLVLSFTVSHRDDLIKEELLWVLQKQAHYFSSYLPKEPFPHCKMWQVLLHSTGHTRIGFRSPALLWLLLSLINIWDRQLCNPADILETRTMKVTKSFIGPLKDNLRSN